MLVDLDDVIDVRDDGTGLMTRYLCGIIQSLGGYAEVSRSMTGEHVLVKGQIACDIDGREIVEELNEGEHVEIYGYPANGQVVGTTCLCIEDIPRHTVPEV